MADKKAVFDYINEYQKEKYDRITILRAKGEKDRLTSIAKEKGYRTVTEFINVCIDEKIKHMKKMTAREVLNLIDWLREQGFDDDKIVECIEATEGRKKDKSVE